MSSTDQSKQLPTLEDGLSLENVIWILAALLAGFFSVYHVYYAYFRPVPRGRHTIFSIGIALLTFALVQLLKTDLETLQGKLQALVLGGIMVSSTVFTVYFYQTYRDILNRALFYSQTEYVLAALLVLVIIIGTWMKYGTFLAGVVTLSLLYGAYGQVLPGDFGHAGLSVQRILENTVLTMNGVYGFIPRIGATWIVIFLIYAGILEAYGALDLILQLGEQISSKFRTGVVQVAVIASLLMGSISGSAAANSATTGAFTIPLMKDRGVKSSTAAAIEATASSGGQVMPPVMGAAAFLIAMLLDIPYIDVIKVSLLPSLLFYLTVSVGTHVMVTKSGRIKQGSTDIASRPLREGIPHVVSLGVLVYLLLQRYDPMTAGGYAILVAIGSQYLWRLVLSDNRLSAMKEATHDTLRGLQIGGVASAPLMVVLGSIAIIVKMIESGNLAQQFTFMMLDLSSGQLFPLLFMAMLLSLIFGMGMPTAAAYIIVALFVSPAVVEFGLDKIYAHLFVFYFAILSAITPPVAIACVITSSISESSFFRSAWEALRLALPAFLLPYVFVLHQSLIQWTMMTPLVFLMVLIGFFGLIMAIHGYAMNHLHIVTRTVALIGGLLVLLSTQWMANVTGVVLTSLVIVMSYIDLDVRRAGSSIFSR